MAIYFIDSNIWLYGIINSDSRKTTIAQDLIDKKKRETVISTQIINEVCVNLIRKVNFNEDQIEELILSFYDDYSVYELDQSILLKAVELRKNHRFSYWDSLVFAAALASGANVLYSEDMQNGFTLEGLTILNPF